MRFVLRPFRRFPVCCPTAYHVGDFESQGIVWNVSPKGWRLSGDLPLRIDEVCSLTVTLPTQAQACVAAGIVLWVDGQVFGLETLVMDEESPKEADADLLDINTATAERPSRHTTPPSPN